MTTKTYKIKYSFFLPSLIAVTNIAGYSGIVGTEYSEELYNSIIKDNTELKDRFEISGVLPNFAKSLEELKADFAEITDLIKKKEAEEKAQLAGKKAEDAEDKKAEDKKKAQNQ